MTRRPQHFPDVSVDKQSFIRGEQAACAVGGIAIYDEKPMMSQNLAPLLRRLAVEVNEELELLADKAAAKELPLTLLGHLSESMNRCISCHDSFRVGDTSHRS
jgi:hypothetical protein